MKNDYKNRKMLKKKFLSQKIVKNSKIFKNVKQIGKTQILKKNRKILKNCKNF